ncbi:unnamed protein product (macronuclear) [Paramecium tetraurelia]|uniref:Uncharacterized protein n=1 Tax=Paramecium tetraurelia TaxID=5888 RepID=A0C4L2_PARTE|nr:uncharacterized protein GSPATT00006228001 [Paramecium tetraurelia]CAK65729.1 unnamed protein product [Paramecium tetraurelia]|eukprot:XP_001433126.1 hypothetical protein (macronuclear) [Paramecium tetraurelia strain d4-2]
MSKFNYVFKPLFIDTFEYSYMDGKTEKSFTIKTKTSGREEKSVIQKSEPIAQFNNETIKKSHKKARTSRQMKQSSKSRNYTINSNTPKNGIRQIESRIEDEFEISGRRNSFDKRCTNKPQLNYLNFNIAIMNGQTSNLFPRTQELINRDNKIMRRKTVETSKVPTITENEIQQFERLENQHPQDIKEKVGRMFAISKRCTTTYNPIRKKSKEREAFTRNLQFLEESFQQSVAPEKKLQAVIQQYFDKKKSFLEEKAKEEEIQLRELSEETSRIRSGQSKMRISTTFLKRFIHQVEKDKQKNNEQQIETQKSFIQSIKSSQINKRRQNAIYSGQVQSLFKKMFHLIVDCVKKMKQMKLTIKELFQHGVIQKKPYEREGSFQFFEAVELNNYGLITFMLQKCRYYAFDINEQGQNPLHVSSTLGHYAITQKLLQCGSYPDSQDLNGYSPLYYAVQSQNIQIVQVLLYYNANPWSNSKYKLESQNAEIGRLLKQSRKIHLLLLLTRHPDREQIWIDSRESLLS